MKKDLNLIEWIENFKKGDYENPSRNSQIDAGWCDWFCKDTALVNRTKSLGKKLIQIVNSPKINPETSYVFFKNNCPVWGSLYDDFRICDIESGNVIYCITPKSGHKVKNGLGDIWGKENDFKEPLFEGSWKEIKDWFLK